MTHRFRTLGNPQFLGLHGDVDLRLPEAGLLAFLCEYPSRAVARRTIAALFWPRVTHARALRSLSQLLYQVRRKIPGVSIVSTPQSLAISDIRSDLDDIRSAVNAAAHCRVLELFRGPFLGDKTSSSHDLDLWRDQINREVAAHVSEALQQHMAAAATPHDIITIMECCDRLIQSGLATAADYSIHIVACMRAGRGQRAERLHSEMCATFADITTVPTFDNLAALARKVEVGADTDRAIRFVGRAAETQQLLNSWKDAVRGVGQVVTILGEPGIGKTRLAEQALRRIALAGSKVWMTRCYAGRRRVRFSAIADLLRENIKDSSSLPAEYAEAISFLTQPWSTGGFYAQLPTDQWHFRLLETLTRLMEEVAKARPLVVLIDDVQWADDFTAQLLTLWALRIPSWRVLLIMTARTEDAEPAPEWLAYDLTTTSSITLGQLSIESASELVRAYESQANVCLSSTVRNQILWQSAGRPFLLLEGLVTAAREADGAIQQGAVFLPESAEALLLRRFRGLSHEAGWLAGIMAALGSAIEPDAIARLSGISDSGTAAALESLSARGIVDLKAGKLDYPHDLMRETAYRQLAPATRALVHLHIAEELASQGADIGVLAQHYARSSSRHKAGPLALAAAESARTNCLFSDCEYYYKLAIETGSQHERHRAVRGFARVLVQTGRTKEMEPYLPLLRVQTQNRESMLLIQLIELETALASENVPISDVLRIARGLTGMAAEVESSDLAVVLGMLLDIAHVAVNHDFGSEVLQAFTGASRSRDRGDFALQIEILTAIWEGATAGYDTALRRLESTGFENAMDATPLTLMSAWFAKGTLLLFAGMLTESRNCFGHAIRLAEAAGETRRLSATYMNSAVTLLELGEYDAARHMLNAVIATPNQAHRLRACTNLAILNYEVGDKAKALNAVQAVLTANASYGSTTCSAVAPAIEGLIHLSNGDLELARERLAWLRENCQESDYLSGDASYTLSFVARMAAIDESVNEAIRILDSGIENSLHKDKMCSLRLTCTKAEILAVHDRDRSYAIAKVLRADASRMHAKPIAARADAVLSGTRIQ